MAALDRGIELQLPLRNVTGRALVVANLRSRGVIDTGGEIHIVVTGAAGDPGRPGEISICLRCTRILIVAYFTAA